MRVRLDIGPDTDVEIERDNDGNPIAVIFKPLFASRTAAAVLAYGVAKSDAEEVLDRFVLSVSGASGGVSKKNRAHCVTAAVDDAAKDKTHG